jgi:hypothetical protein
MDFTSNHDVRMSVELCWDEQPGKGFVGANCASTRGGTCAAAGVTTMTWSLKNQNGDEVAGQTEDCSNGIDFFDPKPGEYTLDVKGTNKDKSQTWKAATCKGLVVLRFDVGGYECNVDAP